MIIYNDYIYICQSNNTTQLVRGFFFLKNIKGFWGFFV